MRIVHVDTGRELRGGQRQLLLLAEGLAARGHGQAVLTRRDTPLFVEARLLGLEVSALSRAALVAAARGADLIHAHDARAHTLAVLAAAGRPLVVSRRVAFPLHTGPLSRVKYRRVTRFLAVSEFVKAQLVAAGIPEKKVSVVYDGVAVSGGPARLKRERRAVAPATADAQKGSRLAAEACRAAGVPLRFSTALEEDLPRAGVFLYLSYSEGLGSAILLAMAHGAPVVASRVGGIPEIVAHERTGLLVENNPAGVAAAVRRVLEDPDGARSRAEAARRRVQERFTDATMVAETERAYRLILPS